MRPDLPDSQQPMSDDDCILPSGTAGGTGAPTERRETLRRTPARSLAFSF